MVRYKGSVKKRPVRPQKGRKGNQVNTSVDRHLALKYAARFFECCDTPRSLALALMIKHKEYAQLVSMGFNWDDYTSPSVAFIDYQCTKLLAKCSDIRTGINTRLVATHSFLDSEKECRNTNVIFRALWNGDFQFPRSVASVLYSAQLKIAEILGDVPKFDALNFGHGPGATFSVREDTSIYKKLTSALECNFAFTPILQEFLEEFPGWVPPGPVEVNIVDGSELTYVPKNAKTDRPICIEPTLNILFQKGIGEYLKHRLLGAGIDLRHQSVNQRLAAVPDVLATVDFQSASDTISYNVVLDLLPIEWVKLLDYGRSPRFLCEGRWYDFHKFSSMGNAYTFELESLIFYSLAWATCKHVGVEPKAGINISVFGDDVIIPVSAYDLFAETARCVGFTVNQEKSFHKGLFRESCGNDVYDGNVVTPFKITTLREHKDVYKTANQLLKIIERIMGLPRGDRHTCMCASRLWNLHGWLISTVSRSRRLLVPASAGDVGFHAPFDVACPTRARNVDGWYYRGISWKPQRAAPSECPPGFATWGRGDLSDHGLSLKRLPSQFNLPYLRYFYSGPKEGELLKVGEAALLPPLDLEDRAEKLFNSHQYDLRNRGQFVVKRRFQFGQWVDPGIPWSDCSLSMIRG